MGALWVHLNREGGKEAVMKRIRLLALLGLVAIALPVGGVFTGGAGAAGSSRTSGEHQPDRDFNLRWYSTGC